MDIRIKVRSGGTALGGLIDGGVDVDARVSTADYEGSQATDSAIRMLTALGVAEHVSDGDEAAVGTTSETTQAETDDGYRLIKTRGGSEGIDWQYYVGQVLTTGGGLTIGGVRIEPTPEKASYFDGDTRDDVPAAGWADKGDPTQRVSNPGDVVRLVWPDGMSRLFIDSGTAWASPSVVGLFDDPMFIEYGDSNVTAHLAARQPARGERIDNFADGQE